MILHCVCGHKISIRIKDTSHQWCAAMKQRYQFIQEHKPCRKRFDKEIQRRV